MTSLSEYFLARVTVPRSASFLNTLRVLLLFLIIYIACLFVPEHIYYLFICSWTYIACFFCSWIYLLPVYLLPTCPIFFISRHAMKVRSHIQPLQLQQVNDSERVLVGTGIGSNSFHYLRNGIGALKLFGPESESFYCRSPNEIRTVIGIFVKRIKNHFFQPPCRLPTSLPLRLGINMQCNKCIQN